MLVSAQLWGQMFALAPEVSRAKAAASRILNIIDLPSGSEPKDVESSGEVTSQRAMSGATIVFQGCNFCLSCSPNAADSTEYVIHHSVGPIHWSGWAVCSRKAHHHVVGAAHVPPNVWNC